MSWLARSIANSLRAEDDDDENDVASHNESQQQQQRQEEEEEEEEKEREREEQEEREEELQGRGVKEDLTELTQTLTQQLWGVASFLAPPPPPPPPPPPRSYSKAFAAPSGSEFDDRSNQSELSDRSGGGEGEPFDAGTGRGEVCYSSFVSENERGNGNGNEDEEEEDEEGFGYVVVGITDEVLAFARNIAMHPETWLDFPLDEEEDLDDFNMSEAQREHAMAIERLAPRLHALRIELCPCHMTESYFWKVYFVLLHSRLNKHDAESLSTPQVMEARALWMHALHKQTKQESDWYERNSLHEKDGTEVFAPSNAYNPDYVATGHYETEKHPVATTEMPCIDKSVIEEKLVTKAEDKNVIVGPSSKVLIPSYEDDEVDWPDEEDSDLGSYKGTIPVGMEDDISFSDLEDDANYTMPAKVKTSCKGAKTEAWDEHEPPNGKVMWNGHQ